MAGMFILRSKDFDTYIAEAATRFRIDKLLPNQNSEGSSAWLSVKDDKGVWTRCMIQDDTTEIQCPYGLGKRADENTGQTKYSMAYKVDNSKVKQLVEKIGEVVLAHILAHPEEYNDEDHPDTVIQAGFNAPVRANKNKQTKQWGPELLRTGVKLPGKDASGKPIKNPLRVYDVDGNLLPLSKIEDKGFMGMPLLNPMFVWQSGTTNTGIKIFTTQVVVTEMIAGLDECRVDVPPEVAERARKRRAEQEAQQATMLLLDEADAPHLGDDTHSKRHAPNPPSPVAQDDASPGSPGFS